MHALAVSVLGLVFGISNTAVTPPSTAARLPDSRSSLASSPGSRKWTWLSITPGRMVSPVQSIRSPASPVTPSPTIRPSRTPTLVCAGPPGVHTVPLTSRRSKFAITLSFRRRASYLFGMSGTTLIDRAVIRLSGEDVRGFLQGLVTSDVAGPAAGVDRAAGPRRARRCSTSSSGPMATTC